MFLRGFGAVVGTVCIGICSLPAIAQSPTRSTPARDLQSILDAKVLRVAVTHFDLPLFHVRGPGGTLVGLEVEMAQQIGALLGRSSDTVDVDFSIVSAVNANGSISVHNESLICDPVKAASTTTYR
jgi:ABC-type amino acid transport substrate-binding protein